MSCISHIVHSGFGHVLQADIKNTSKLKMAQTFQVILFSKISIHSNNTIVFIGMLLCMLVSRRSKYKSFGGDLYFSNLHCVSIIL